MGACLGDDSVEVLQLRMKNSEFHACLSIEVQTMELKLFYSIESYQQPCVKVVDKSDVL